MGCAAGYITKLQQGETVSFRSRGGSMTGRIESGPLCAVAPRKHKKAPLLVSKKRGELLATSYFRTT
jgi:hypothetical protein